MSTTATPKSSYPPVRRVVTGHDTEGRSIVAEDAALDPQFFRGTPSLVTGIYRHDEFPAKHPTGEFVDAVREKPQEVSCPGGTVFSVVETPPGGRSPMHRTVSLDYAILMKGTLTVQLNDGKTFELNEGDILIQRGTMHAWINNSNDWARLYCVMLPAEKVKVEDKELEMVFLKPQ